jgi:tetratricopeptide (TPR) repeat protein
MHSADGSAESAPVGQDITAQRDVYSAGRDQLIYNVTGVPTEPIVPALLPRDTPTFTGRQRELALIKELSSSSNAVVVSAIDGVAGAGKTALALHAAHTLISQFPDGQLYADFRGYTEGQESVDPGIILEQFLRRLGLPAEEVPTDLDGRSAAFRTMLSKRRMIILLDNVLEESQVRPLLPGTGSSFVLVTSRSMLPGLELDRRIPLDVMSREESAELLVKLIGRERAAAEFEAVQQIADLCGDLPLALRIAGQLLAVHPGWPASRLAAMLIDEQSRLSRLSIGDKHVRAAFSVSYRQLSGPEAWIFRVLGLHPGPNFGIPAVARLADVEEDHARAQLERLALANLIVEDDASRFRMHDLLRLFARETCEGDDGQPSCRQAIARVMSYYFALARFLNCCTDPRCRNELIKSRSHSSEPTPSSVEALEVFEAERANFLAALSKAVSDNRHDKALELAQQIGAPLDILRHLDELISVRLVALESARHLNQRSAEAEALGNLGAAYLSARRFSDSEDTLNAALGIFQELCDHRGIAVTLVLMGTASAETRCFDQAIAFYDQAKEIYSELGDRNGQATASANIGMVYIQQRKFEEAIGCLAEAVDIFREDGDRTAEAAASNGMGNAYGQMSQFTAAASWLEKAVELHHSIGNIYGEAMSLSSLGNAYLSLESFDEAIESYTAALAIFRQTRERHGEAETLNNLGVAETNRGLYDRAIAAHEAALAIHQELDNRHSAAVVLNNIGRLHVMLGEFDEAERYFEEAVALYRETGDDYRLEQTLRNLQLARQEATTALPDADVHRPTSSTSAHSLGDRATDW